MADTATAASQPGLLEKTWERIQKKTFTGWVNSHLSKVGLKIEDLATDFQDGIKLIKLLEVISGDTITGYEKNPGKMRIKQVTNSGIALKFIQSKGVKLPGTGPEEIVDQNAKMILGLIWTVILRFQIQDISEEELSAKEALLLWVQKKTKGYRDVNVQNFHMSFQDGLAFCALIHKHRPDLIDYDSLSKENKLENLELAFDVAEKHLGIAKILDPKDIVDLPKPDERSIMTYVAAMYHVFASYGKADAAAKNVANVIEFAQAAEKLKLEFQTRAKELVEWIEHNTVKLDERNFPHNLEGIQDEIGKFNNFKSTEKPPKAAEKTEVESVYNNLQTKLRLNKRSPYVPPAGLAPEDIDRLWNQLNRAENERGVALREELKRQKHLASLVNRFKVKAAALDAWGNARFNFMESDGLGEDIAAIEAKLKNHEAFEEDYTIQSDKLTKLEKILEEIVAGGHSDATWCQNKYAELGGLWGKLKTRAEQRKTDLQAELDKQKQIQELLLTFAKKSTVFARVIEDADDVLLDPFSVSTVEEVHALQMAFDGFVGSTLNELESSLTELNELATQIKGTGHSETTYSEYDLDTLSGKWSKTQANVEQRRALLAAEATKQAENETLRVEWANAAKEFSEWVDAQESRLNEKSSSVDKNKLEDEVAELKALSQDLKSHHGKLDHLITLGGKVDAAGITENKHSELTLEGLKMKWDKLNSVADSTVTLLENELISKKHGNVSGDELNEFKEMFNHFDKDGDQVLTKLELKSCLQALGQDPTDAELDTVLAQQGQDREGTRVLNFDAFVTYMKKKHSSTDTADSIKDAFKVIAGDKDFVTKDDLARVLPAEKVTFLVANMPVYNGPDGSALGFDYKAYAAHLYA